MANSYLIVGGNFDLRNEAALKIILREINDKDWSTKNNPDFFLLDLPTTIGIEAIRDLQNRLNLKPFGRNRQVCFISRAENLSSEAQNSLLKTIEEPPGNSLIILSSPEVSLLLPTINSRCQIVRLPILPQVTLTKEEEEIYKKIQQKIFSPQIGERWQVLDEGEIATDRLKAIEWVDKMTFLVRKSLIEDLYQGKKTTAPVSLSLSLKILFSLNLTKKYLQANTNVRLTLENFLLSLPEILPTPGVGKSIFSS